LGAFLVIFFLGGGGLKESPY